MNYNQGDAYKPFKGKVVDVIHFRNINGTSTIISYLPREHPQTVGELVDPESTEVKEAYFTGYIEAAPLLEAFVVGEQIEIPTPILGSVTTYVLSAYPDSRLSGVAELKETKPRYRYVEFQGHISMSLQTQILEFLKLKK